MKSNTANIYIKAKDETKEGINKALKSVDSLATGIANLAKGFLAFQVVDATLGAISNKLGEITEKFSGLNDFENLGFSVDKAYELTEALSLAGMSSDDVLKTIGDLNAKLEEAPDNPKLLKTLKEMGLSLNDIKNGDVSANYEKILDYLSKVENKEKAIAQAREVFGKQAITLVDGAGEERFTRIRDRIKESTDQIRAAAVTTDEYKKNVQELSQIFELELVSAINGPLYALNAVLETLIKTADQGNKTKDAINIEDQIGSWKEFAKDLSSIVNIVGNVTSNFVNLFDILFVGFNNGTKLVTFLGDTFTDVLGSAISDITSKLGKLFDAFVKVYTLDFSGLSNSLDGILDASKTDKAFDNTKKRFDSLVAASVESQQRIFKSLDNISNYKYKITDKSLNETFNKLDKQLKDKNNQVAPGGQNRTGGKSESADSVLNELIKRIEQSYAYEKLYTENSIKLNDLLYSNQKKTLNEYFIEKDALTKKNYYNELNMLNEQLAATRKIMGTAATEKERTKIQEKENELLIKKSKLELDFGLLTQTNDFARTKAQDEYNDKLDEMRAKLKEIAGDFSGANAIRFDVEARNSGKGLNSKDQETNDKLNAQKKILSELQAEASKLSLATSTRNLEEEKLSLLGGNVLSNNKEIVRLRSEELILLEKQKAVLEALASDPANKDNSALKTALLQAQVDLIKFKQDIDPIAKQINDVLSSSIENALGDLINGTKSFKDAFLSVLKSIEQEITKFVAKSLTQELMGGLNKALAPAGGGSSGGGIGGFFSGIFDLFGGARATGGNVEAGKSYLVGENGPEILHTGSSGYVVNNRDTMKNLGVSNSPIVVNIYAQDAQSFRNSRDQIAIQMQNAIASANRNR